MLSVKAAQALVKSGGQEISAGLADTGAGLCVDAEVGAVTTKASIRAAWKRNEREIAAKIGGRRVPVTGRQRGDAPDIEHNWLSVEAKLRQRVPSWIKDGMDQAQKSKTRPHDMPVLIIRERGQSVDDALICTTLKEFRERYL